MENEMIPSWPRKGRKKEMIHSWLRKGWKKDDPFMSQEGMKK